MTMSDMRKFDTGATRSADANESNRFGWSKPTSLITYAIPVI